MTYEQAVNDIINLFKNNWSATQVIYPNEVEDIGTPDYFVRLTVRPVRARQVAVGAKKHRRLGVVTAQVFVKQDTGVSDLGALEEMATNIFQDLNGIHFQNVGADRIGKDGYGYYQSNVNADFRWDV